SMLEAKKSRKKRPVRKKPPSTENDATFIGPFIKEATEAPKGLSKKKSSLAKDLNTRQPLVSILVLIDTTFVIVHSETASRGNTSASLTTRANPSQSALNESLPQQEEIKLDDLVKMITKNTDEILMEWNFLDNDQPINVSSEEETKAFMDMDDKSPHASPKTLQI
ncbi:hypothetical protein Tco_1289593, partial [Tanacetum coccineum]